EGVQSCIHWLPSGRAFEISNPELFVNTVLKINFNSVQFESFVVRLGKWGFRRLGDKVNKRYLSYTFASPLFRRDQPHLCSSMRLIKKYKPSRERKTLFHMFDATEKSTTMPTISLNESPAIVVNQVKTPSWENTSPQSWTYRWGQNVPFSSQHYSLHPVWQYLPRQNRPDWISPSPKHHQENALESKSEKSREVLAAVALMNLANFAELKLSHPPKTQERSNTSANI
ncbi:hypothetical protein ACHAW6_002848, partial [Cyclotella cf. meneghiniana]